MHGRLAGHNILFDSDHCIQIVDYNRILLEVGENKNGNENESEGGIQLVGFSRERRTPAFHPHGLVVGKDPVALDMRGGQFRPYQDGGVLELALLSVAGHESLEFFNGV
jgi:hypothetical protein